MTAIRRRIAAAVSGVTLLTLAAPTARADGRTLLMWSGTVDREAIITMRGAFVDTRGDGFETYRDARVRVTEALPRVNGVVRVRVDGRGDVDVIEQPSALNGYTARVRVRDRQSGADRYRLVFTWEGQPTFDRRDRRDDERWDDRRGDGWGDRGRRGGRDDEYAGRTGAGALHWSGNVDDVAEIRIRGRRVEFYARSGRQLSNVEYDVRGAGLPQASMPLDLRRFAGRGNVTIAEFPRAYNDWTAVIRIEDLRSGPDRYDIDLRW